MLESSVVNTALSTVALSTRTIKALLIYETVIQRNDSINEVTLTVNFTVGAIAQQIYCCRYTERSSVTLM